MNIPRLSIRTLLVVVALAALDFGMFRWAFSGFELATWVNVISLPMANLLLFMTFRSRSFREEGWFERDRIRFQSLGWVALIAVLVLTLGFPQILIGLATLCEPVRLAWLNSSSYRSVPSDSPTAIRIWWCAEISFLVTISTVCTLTQIMFARGGVWLATPRKFADE